jgi:hypothetical protein
MSFMHRAFVIGTACTICFFSGIWIGKRSWHRSSKDLTDGVLTAPSTSLARGSHAQGLAKQSQSLPAATVSISCSEWLKTLSLQALSDLYQVRSERFQKEIIEKRFPVPHSDSDSRDQVEELLNAFESLPKTGLFWTASTQVGSSNAEQFFELVFSVFPLGGGEPVLDPSATPKLSIPFPMPIALSSSSPSQRDLSWALQIRFRDPDTAGEQGTISGTSGSAGGLSRREGRYFAVASIYSNPVQIQYQSLAVSIPMPNATDGILNLLSSKEEKWIQPDQAIRWEAISAEEADQFQKQ